MTPIRELFQHQEWADSALLKAVRAHPGASEDEEIRRLLHHILVVQHAYLGILWGLPFDREKDGRPPASFAELEARFRAVHAKETARAANLEEAVLERMVDMPYVEGLRFPVRDGLLQVVLHSQGHRAQCATRLRVLGGKPPILDYILWVRDRPKPEW